MNDHSHRRDSGFFRLGTLVLTLLLFPPLASAQLNISNRTFIPLSEDPQRTPTTIAVDRFWSAMAQGEPIPITSLSQGYLVSNPVIVTGPWNGNPYIDVNIEPPTPGANTTEEFGSSVAIQGFRIAVGVATERTWSSTCSTSCLCCYVDGQEVSGGGKVRLYVFDGTEFQPERTITFGGIDDRFGHAVALERWNLLVGSPGAVPGGAHIFDPNTGTLLNSFNSPDATGSDLYATVVALDDDVAVVGAPGSDSVYVYRDDGQGNWSAAGTLDSPGSGSEFGMALAADGDRIIVGAPGLDKAFIFEDDGDAGWAAVAELAGTADSGFGRAVAIVGDTAFVAAPDLLSGLIRAGVVERYDRLDDGAWSHSTQLTSQAPADGDQFGFAIQASTAMLSVLESGLNGQYVYTRTAYIYDPDGDGTSYIADNCPGLFNPDQSDTDDDGNGNACDDDDDGDGLSDADEAIAGSDPLDRDTDDDGLEDAEDPYPTQTDGDGDGVDDGLDNCPVLFNDQSDYDGDGEGDTCDSDIDGDGLGNDDEVVAGTDPVDWDSDDDGHPDGKDDYPLDFYDGWNEVYRFKFNADRVIAGNGVVLARNSLVLRTYIETPAGWVEAPPPPITIPAGLRLDQIQMKGTRAVIYLYSGGAPLDHGELHLYEWSQLDGWSFIDSTVTEGRIRQLSMDGDTIAASGEASRIKRIWIYKLVAGELQRVVDKNLSVTNVLVSGDTVVTGHWYFDTIQIFETFDDYAGNTVTFSISNVEEPLLEVGPGEILAISGDTAYWLEKNGSWTLTPSSVATGYSDIGDAGLVGVYEGYNHDIHSIRLSDEASIGIIQNRSYNSDFDTNDVIVTRAGTGWVDIFVLENVVQPPGC